jgi:ankyrin repeat protein
VEILIQHGAKLEAQNELLWGPLHTACNEGKTECAKMLIDKGALINAQESMKQRTPLHVAVHQGKVETAKMLVKNGADRELLDKEKKTPLMLATAMNNQSLVQALSASSGVCSVM